MDNQKNQFKPELPTPHIDQGSLLPSNEQFGSYSPELKVQPMPGEKNIQASTIAVQASNLASAHSNQAITQLQTDDNNGATNDPALSDDNDVNSKEWVDKAKNIVSHTQGDPHAKSVQLTYLKKDYIQKRYGKTIKVPEDQSLGAHK
jgi:hypothetical protein